MSAINQYGPLLARILLAAIFVLSGVGKISGFDGTVGYIQSVGLPAASLLAMLTILVEVGGGIMLVIGWKARWAAAALFGFTLLAALLFHAFWASPADQAMMQQTHFMKNLAIAGGMLMFVVHGAGPLAMDGRR